MKKYKYIESIKSNSCQIEDIKKLYNKFFEENKNLSNIILRKSKFLMIVKKNYKSITFNDYENIYKEHFKDNEHNFFWMSKKKD
jgi:hypothetical protein